VRDMEGWREAGREIRRYSGVEKEGRGGDREGRERE